MKILVVDVGGNNIKLLVSGQKAPRKVPSGPTLTAARMAAAVKKAVAGWKYDAVTIGFPGPVKGGRIAAEPVNLGRRLGALRLPAGLRPSRSAIVNDAAMQALGSYRGRRDALPRARHRPRGRRSSSRASCSRSRSRTCPYRNGKTYEDFLGKRGLDRMGKKRWRQLVGEIVARLHHAFQVDEVVLGGGNVKQLKALPPHDAPRQQRQRLRRRLPPLGRPADAGAEARPHPG